MVLADGIVVRENTGVGGSRGLYASVAIRAGEMVWREEPEAEPQFTSTPRTLAWVEALPAEAQAAYRHFMCVRACVVCCGGSATPTRLATRAWQV